ncbi:MAG: glutathione synthetase [Planctomycetaceae bacterium]
MKLGFVVNDVMTEHAAYTTTRLALTAMNLGHESYTLGVGDFIYAPDGSIHANARGANGTQFDSPKPFLAALQAKETADVRIKIDDLDVLFLRNDPSEDALGRPWAQSSAILFGQLAAARGVIVVNDPENLANAINKTYFQHFPEQVRPKTCISRDIREIKAFIAEQHDKVVIKPLQGSGGHSVFLIKEDDHANVNQMIEAVIRDGYCIVQEYLPAAVNGDVRMFVMNGHALSHQGKYAAFRRVNKSGDARSNVHSGGECVEAEVTDKMLELVEIVRPKLVHDGMFLVGLDIVEDKLMEINVFSPGGLGSAQQLTGVDFTEAIIRDLERKVNYKAMYNSRMRNVEIATL